MRMKPDTKSKDVLRADMTLMLANWENKSIKACFRGGIRVIK